MAADSEKVVFIDTATGKPLGEPIYTLAEFAEREKVPVQTVRLWRMKGYDPVSFKVGKHVRYRLADIEAWEQEQINKVAA